MCSICSVWLLCDRRVISYTSHNTCFCYQRALGNVSDEEWLSIPDVGDARNKKQRNAHIRPDRYTPVPDSVLQRATVQSGSYSSLDTKQQVHTIFSNMNGSLTSLVKFLFSFLEVLLPQIQGQCQLLLGRWLLGLLPLLESISTRLEKLGTPCLE